MTGRSQHMLCQHCSLISRRQHVYFHYLVTLAPIVVRQETTGSPCISQTHDADISCDGFRIKLGGALRACIRLSSSHNTLFDDSIWEKTWYLLVE